jgi:hypothetical protein
MLGAAASLVARYRIATRDVRRQIQWYVLAGTLVVCTIVPLMFLFLFVDQAAGVGQQIWVAFFVASALIPIAVGIAITRYRLYEIDRLVNRTILYATLTAMLAGLFTAGVGVAQRLFVAMTGQTSDAALVLTTFVVATAYAPLRSWLEAIVDRRFRYEKSRFGAYRDEVVHVLEVIDPTSAAQRLCREAVRELEAEGGAVLDPGGSEVATAGNWPVPAIVRIGLAHDLILAVGPRRDGEPHEAAAITDLGEIMDLLSRAMASPAAGPRQP